MLKNVVANLTWCARLTSHGETIAVGAIRQDRADAAATRLGVPAFYDTRKMGFPLQKIPVDPARISLGPNDTGTHAFDFFRTDLAEHGYL